MIAPAPDLARLVVAIAPPARGGAQGHKQRGNNYGVRGGPREKILVVGLMLCVEDKMPIYKTFPLEMPDTLLLDVSRELQTIDSVHVILTHPISIPPSHMAPIELKKLSV
ncbi:hypothetical protein MTR67_043255 [Solanum verrucosum]|uniref:Uncharacterized protein n=1 Tax=Solanum verrucosum TaxID=315347 RepID=A0AAF0UNR4_SOLVR|nr:hypothetical protein MTR67_043255 [Solanum verrucosum]